jgi:GNAT superfamily N-acetyltransferase
VLLSDGSVATIRPLSKFDHAELTALHVRASDRSRWLRFLAGGTTPAEADADLCAEDDARALVAEVSGSLVGVAATEPLSEDVERVSVLVDDPWHGRGVVTTLLEQLAADAGARGISRLVADVPAEKQQLLRVFLDTGFSTAGSSSEGVVTLVMDPMVAAELS